MNKWLDNDFKKLMILLLPKRHFVTEHRIHSPKVWKLIHSKSPLFDILEIEIFGKSTKTCVMTQIFFCHKNELWVDCLNISGFQVVCIV